MEWTKNLKNWIFFYWIGLNFGFDFKRKMLYPLHYFLSPFPLPILIWLWLKWPSFFKPYSFPHTIAHSPSLSSIIIVSLYHSLYDLQFNILLWYSLFAGSLCLTLGFFILQAIKHGTLAFLFLCKLCIIKRNKAMKEIKLKIKFDMVTLKCHLFLNFQK